MSEQESIRCVIMRGGTSKGLYFRELDLPRPGPIRDWLLLRQHLFGSRAVRDRRGQGRRAGRRGRCPDLEHQHGKVLIASVQVKDGKALVLGDCAVPGVPGTGAEILMSWVGTVGAKTGQLLPAGTVLDRFEMGVRGSSQRDAVRCCEPGYQRLGFVPTGELDGNGEVIVRPVLPWTQFGWRPPA
jgi:2-methylaconitate cis-trans-isomerase PrpF